MIVALAGGGIYGTMRYEAAKARAELDRELSLAKRAGMAITIDDLYRKPIGTPASNAALALAALEPKLRSPTYDPKLVVCPLTEPLKPGTLAMLTKCQPIIGQIVEASKRPDYVVVRTSRTATFGPVEDLVLGKSLAKLLCSDAIAKCNAGLTDQAFEELAAADRIAVGMSREPNLLAIFVGQAIGHLVYISIQNILWNHGDNSLVLALSKKAATRPAPGDGWRLALGSLVSIRQQFLEFRSNGIPDEASDMPADEKANRAKKRYLLTATASSSIIEAKIIRSRRIAFGALPASLSNWDSVDQAIAKGNEILASDQTDTGRLAKDYGEGFEGFGSDYARTSAERGLIACAVAVLAAKKETGTLPHTLPAGFSGLDPFAGKPFKALRTAGTLTLYSVGYDRRDGHGDRLKDICLKLR